MKRIVLLTVIINWLFINVLTAQNPFKEFGVDVPVITLSKGKYPEFIPNDTIHRIGTVVIDTRTGKIIELVNTDSIEVTYNYRPDVASRWISPDPLAEEYTDWTPYHYVRNNPIHRIDPNGMWDDTYIYDMQGNHVTTIEDDLDNQIVFMDNTNASTFKTLNKWYDGFDKNGIAKLARSNASAIFTQNTANQLKSFYDNSYSKSNNEPGGILWINPENKELQVWGMEGTGGNSFDPWNFLDGGIASGNFIGKNEIGGNPFAIWHGHPGVGFESATPTDMGGDDYHTKEKIGKTNHYFSQFFKEGAVGLILTKETVTVYPMWQPVRYEGQFKSYFSDDYSGNKRQSQWGIYKYNGLNYQNFWKK